MTDIVRVTEDRKTALLNLIEKYEYEFSQWDKNDVDDNGLYNYEWIDEYFSEENCAAYFIMSDNKLAGFILINTYPEAPDVKTDFTMSEFFVMHKYRRKGCGREAAVKAFDNHRGKWQLKCHPHNTASVYFWNSVVSGYTKGDFTLIEGYPDHEVDYEDGTPANVYLFEN